MLIFKDAAAPNARAFGGPFTPSVVRGLAYYGIFGTDASTTGRNHAPNQPDATVVGNPTFSDGYVEFDGSLNYVQTQASDTSEISGFVVYKNSDTLAGNSTRPFLISNNSGPAAADSTRTAIGISLYESSATQLTLVSSRLVSGASSAYAVSVVPTSMTPWGIAFFRAGAQMRDLWQRTQGIRSPTDTTSNPRDPATTLMRVGSGIQTDGGRVLMASAGIANVVWTEAEMAQIYAEQQVLMAAKAITI